MKRLYIIIPLIFILSFSSSATVFAQTNNVINNSSDQQTTDIGKPPADFNPIKASDSDLRKYHFPSRPDNQGELEQWKNAMEHAKYYINPEISESNTVVTRSFENNWSGYVVEAADNKVSGITPKFDEASAAFTVPANCGTKYPSYWVGIGGYGTASIWQAGIQMNATTLAGQSNYVEFWTEDYPQYVKYTTNIPVNCNNQVYVSVYYGGTYGSSAFLENISTGKYTSLTYSNAQITVPNYDGGSCADFICEAHYNYGTFPSSTFSNCYAASSTTPTYGLGEFSNALRLVLRNNGIVYQSPSAISGNGFLTNS